ncbi:Asp-tRNA(Asn)/Glu-tRNA(Gln) amidotransferase subunit GatC [Candidatus Binatia bacterium]|nr:Asp-tRNA(Asn)/Glu-tRNA(Gln) amidotransferase subunit GatC [Candidatus Binatia bacterium]
MALSRDEVHRVALLARLDLSGEEEAAIAAQLDHILAHFQELSSLEVDNVEPTAHAADVSDAFRDDAVTNPPADEALRANAPARDGDFFKVPKIIE